MLKLFCLEGMGGKLEYFGFWIDAEFGKGYCSESCTTYRNYKMMSGSKVSDSFCFYSETVNWLLKNVI